MRFYVYEIGPEDAPIYVGKGSGCRLKAQERRFGVGGREVARFKTESDAFVFERHRIAELAPALNRSAGGEGGRVKRRRHHRRARWEIEMEKIGTRVYAARALLKLDLRGYLEPSKIDAIRQVAYGGGS